MEGKEKLMQIYEAVADTALSLIESAKDGPGLEKEDLEMIRIAQSLYECINTNYPKVCTALASNSPTD